MDRPIKIVFTIHTAPVEAVEIQRAMKENNVVVLTQGSVARLVPILPPDAVPVLSSLRSGLETSKEQLA